MKQRLYNWTTTADKTRLICRFLYRYWGINKVSFPHVYHWCNNLPVRQDSNDHDFTYCFIICFKKKQTFIFSLCIYIYIYWHRHQTYCRQLQGVHSIGLKIMACHLSSAKPLSKHMLGCNCNLFVCVWRGWGLGVGGIKWVMGPRLNSSRPSNAYMRR